MDILLKNVRIIDSSSPYHQQTADIFIQNGRIAEIGTLTHSAEKQIDIKGLCVSPGWVDVFSNFCDPGYEYKETLQTGAIAAATGGYTDVLVIPNTTPALHNKAAVEYIVQRTRNLPVTVHPIGAITKNMEGKELAEMYDMQQSGAVAFSDGTCTVQSAGLLLKALQYVKAVNRTIIQLPDDQTISKPGLMNEGVISTQLGLPGKPAIAEELMIARDIELSKYTGSRLHITGISTAKSIELIRQAKAEGIPVSCSVTPYHLCFTDADLVSYDTNLKVNPPLRTAKDRDALRKALLDGVIDCIAVHHFPEDIDHKVVEFEYARYGMTGLETAFGVVHSCVPELALENLVRLFSTTPRTLFGLPAPGIAPEQEASLTLFLPDAEWTVDKLWSKSKNSPFLQKTLKGKPVGIINKDSLFLGA